MSSNPEIDLSNVPAEFVGKALSLSAAYELATKQYESSKADTKALKDAADDARDSLLLYLASIRAENPLFDQA